MKKYTLKVLVLVSFIAACTACLVCTNDYNPFSDPKNAGLVITGMSFTDGDEVDIFTSESITVVLTVPELIDHFSIRTQSNRLFQDDQIDFHASSGSPLSSGPYQFLFSFSDTGAKKIEFLVRRTNGETVTHEVRCNVKSPLRPDAVVGKFGAPIRLVTPAVGDADVVYMWDFKMGTTILSARADTNVTITTAGAHGIGFLRVSDGYVFSPPVSFNFSLTDSQPPQISFLEDNYVKSGDTIKAAESTFFFGITIQDRGENRIDSASINGGPFDIIEEPVFIKIFERIDTLSQPLPVSIYVRDNKDDRNDTIVNLWLVYDPAITVTSGVRISILVPPKDNTISVFKDASIMGVVERYTGDTIDCVIRLRSGSVTETIPVHGKYEAQWSWTAPLKDSINIVQASVFNKQGDSLASVSRIIIYDPDFEDTVHPIILEIIDAHARDNITPFYKAYLKIIAFDEGSGIDTLRVNGVVYPPYSEYVWLVEVPLVHCQDGNLITVVAKDRRGLSSTKSVTLFQNSPPEVKKPFQPPYPLKVGARYVDTCIYADPENDSVEITLLDNKTSLRLDKSGGILWIPSASEKGLHDFTIRLFDGFQSALYSFSIMVVDSTESLDSVRFQTTEADFPPVLTTGMLLQQALQLVPGSGKPPYKISGYFEHNKQPLEMIHDTLFWQPSFSDTGRVRMKIVVVDSFLTSDTLTPSILVSAANRPLTIKTLTDFGPGGPGVFDMSDSASTKTINYKIEDPDPEEMERFTVHVRQNGIYTDYPIYNNTFQVQINSKLKPEGYDTIIIVAKDIAGHVATCTLYAFYGGVPFQPSDPGPHDGALLQSSTVQLSWSGGDPDGDIYYDVYAGICPFTEKIAGGLQQTSFQWQTPRSGVYCWKVIASDGKSRVESPEWTFRLRAPDHVQFAAFGSDFAGTYEALQDSVILPLTIQPGTGRAPFVYHASFVGGNEISVSGDTLRYLPQATDTGVQWLHIVVTDQVANSDTLRRMVRVTPPLPLELTMLYDGDFTEEGALDLSSVTEPLTVEFALSDPDPDTVMVYQLHTMSVGRADSNGIVRIVLDPWKTSRIRDTIRLVIKDYPDLIDTTFVVHYGSAPGVPSLTVPSNDSLVVSDTVLLTWMCSDPDNNQLLYDIYFGDNATPPLEASGLTTPDYSLQNLPDGTYYWRVIARDARFSTEGELCVLRKYSQFYRVYINTTNESDGADIGADLFNVPVLVRLDPASGDFSSVMANGFNNIHFRRNGPDGALLPFQIDSWDPVNSSASIWVLIDTLKGNDSTQHIYLRYSGNTGGSSDGTAVFDTAYGFAGVWHLEESGLSTVGPGVYRDATALQHHGDDLVASSGKEGVIGLGQTFDGSDWIKLPDNTDLGRNVSSLTGDVWFKATPGAAERVMFSISDDATDDSRFEMRLNAAGEVEMYTRGALQEITLRSTLQFDDDLWHNAVYVADYANSRFEMYIDGEIVADSIQQIGASPVTQTPFAAIGSKVNGSGGFFFGSLDEIRLAHVKRSADWIRFGFKNQKIGSRIVQVRN